VDPSYAMLTSAGMTYRPLAAGYAPHRALGTQGLPFTSGLSGSLVTMAMNGRFQRMMGEVGMTPMGLDHDQNVYDRLMKQRYTLMQMQAMQMAAQADRDEYAKTLGGLAVLSGTPFGSEQRRAAQSLAQSAATMSPLFAEMMPDFLDKLGGVKGSSTVMAKRLMEAGRYRMDPVTGRMGMSAESVGALSMRMYGDLYGRDYMPDMRGISAGNVGSLAQELQMRGMVGTSAASSRFYGMRGDDPRAGTLRAISEMRQFAPNDVSRAALATGVDPTKPGGLTAEDLDKLRLDPRVADKLRSFDTESIKKSIKSYVGVVSAMRDIFGDMGHANAPMAELIAGIEALTMNGMNQIDPSRMTSMVRQTHNLAKQTGVSMENVLMIQQHAANRASQMGMDPIFAIQATQGGLAFGGAYRAQGHAAHVAWGAMSADQIQQLDTNLRIQAGSSNTANRMAVASRLAESVGGFDPNSDAGRYVAAIRGGLTEYRKSTGELGSIMLSDRDFTRLMAGARNANGTMTVSEGDVQTMLGQRDTNREHIERYGMSDTVRRLQGEAEVHPFVGHRMQETLTARFRDQILRRNPGLGVKEATAQAMEAAAGISQKVTRRMFDMSTEEFADNNLRNQGIADIIQEELGAVGSSSVLEGLDHSQRRDFLTQTADRFYGAANRAIRESAYRSFGNLQNMHRLTNRSTLDAAEGQQMAAKFSASMQEALAPLGHGSMLSRALEAVKNVRSDDPTAMLSVIAESLGGVSINDINKSLLPKFQNLTAQRKLIEDLQASLASVTDPSQRTAILERLEVSRRELAGQASTLAKTGEQFGLFSTESLTHKDLVRALGTSRELLTAQRDIVGVQGNFGAEVSARNLQEFRNSLDKDADSRDPLLGALTDTDKMAAVIASRKADLSVIRRHIDGDPKAKLSEKQKQVLDRYVDSVRKDPARIGFNMNALQRAAFNMMLQDSTDVGPADLNAITPELARSDDAVASAIIRGRRRSLPVAPSEEAIAEIQKQHPDITREEAAEIASARIRARRLGLDKEIVDAHIAKVRTTDPKAYQGPLGESEAIAELFGMRVEGAYSDPKATEQLRQRFADFWKTDDGRAFRDQTRKTFGDIDTVAERLVTSPKVGNMMGTRAFEMAETLREDQQRLRELAMYHTGGDLSKLMAHDFTGIKEKDPAKLLELTTKIKAEVNAIQDRQRASITELLSQEGSQGRRFQLGDEATFRRQVIEAKVKAGTLSRAQADEILASGLTPGQALNFERMRVQVGGEESARRIARVPDGVRDLSDLQLAAVTAVRFGAGSEDEARVLYGTSRWDALSPTARTATLKKMQTGVASAEEAMALLNISQEQLKDSGPDGDLAKKIRAVQGGLATDRHAMEVIGPLTPQQPGETDEAFAKRKAAYAERVLEVRQGLYHPDTVRSRMKLGKDKLHTDDKILVDKLREDWGNEQEARRLLRFGATATLTPAQQEELDKTIADVAVVRRLRTDDETNLAAYEEKDKRVKLMASRKGISVDKLSSEGEKWLLTPEQKARRDKVARGFLADHGAAERLEKDIASVKFSLGTLGDDISNPGTNSTRARLQDSLAHLEGLLGGRKKSMAAAEATVNEDARARGVTASAYLLGQGWIDRDGLTQFRGANAERRMALDKVEDIASGLGVQPERLLGASSVLRRIQEQQRRALGKLNASPLDLGRDILKEYGMGVGDTPSTFEQDFSKMLNSAAGRGMGERVLTSQRELLDVAKKRAGGAAGMQGIDAMARSYFEALKSQKPEDMVAFRKTYGMYDLDKFNQVTGDSNSQFERFQRALQFQQQTGLLSFTGDRNALRSKIQALAETNGELRGGPEANGQQTPTKIEMSGSVTLKGDRIDLAGAWGGGRAFVPGGLT